MRKRCFRKNCGGGSVLPLLLSALLPLSGCGPDREPSPLTIQGNSLAGVCRFYPDGSERGDFPPSLALLSPFPEIDRVPAGWTVFPEFFRDPTRAHAARIPVEADTSLYGTGEIAGSLRRNGAVTETWNVDCYGYSDRDTHLYQSHPWVLAVRRNGTAFGVLADTTRRATIDLTDGILFSVRETGFPVVVLEGDSPQQVLRRLTDLVGRMPLPPLWALGYHQCRFSYYPDSQVRAIADGFRSRNLPCDVIWIDIDYMDGYRIFTFDPLGFPDPAATNEYLHSRGFKAVWMIDPGVKKDPGYFVYDQGTSGNHWVLTHDGREFHGPVWPGPCAFPDFTRPETRSWWSGLYADFLAQGIDGVWNDMNEPALLIPLWPDTRTMPATNRHRGGGGLPPGTHALYHNVYGMLMVQATREGLLAANPGRRPFVLTRANYLGGHRYAATWTGDNTATWDHLYWSVPMILNLGLSGQPFVGPDLGGHIGNTPPDLYARWFGVGALFPFSRGHKTKMLTRFHEPWQFGPEVEAGVRTALERRYRLLPYLYTLFHEASLTGLPVMRPVLFADPADLDLRDEDHAFLLGADLLVEPKLTPLADHVFREPRGIWRSVTLVGEDPAADPAQPVLKIRGGAIIPLGRVIQSTAEESLDPLTLLVCLDDSGRAEGQLYEDAGEGFAYQAGEYLLTKYAAAKSGNRVLVRIRASQGEMPRPQRRVVAELVTDSGIWRAEGWESRGIEITIP